VRRLGAAWVVNFDHAELTGEKTQSDHLAAEICTVKEDYQSGSKQPHSKDFVDLRSAFNHMPYEIWHMAISILGRSDNGKSHSHKWTIRQ
jgi:hypothetical protein